jgi:hypothetical protein
MKRSFVTSSLCAVLSLGALVAAAQTTPADPTPPPSSEPVTDTAPPPDTVATDPTPPPSAALTDTPPSSTVMTDNSPPPSGDADANKVDPQDQSKGQELVGSQKPTPAEAQGHPSPPTIGQDKAAGNNLIEQDNGKMQMADKAPPDFQSLDTQKRGYITLADAGNHLWLNENFARCDANHDGQLTQQEYSQCLY